MKNVKPILEKVAFGWGQFEPAIVGFIAAKLPFAARGLHGNAKTTVAKMLAKAMAVVKTDLTADEVKSVCNKDDGMRYFSCDKASMIVLAGIPDMDATKRNGSLAFIPSKSTVIGPNVIGVVLDEITRSPKETQNYLLEIIENKTCAGVPLHYQFLIATLNPETYKGALKLDAALWDRFAGVIPISDLSNVQADDVEHMISINMEREHNEEYNNSIANELRPRIQKTREIYQQWLKQPDTLGRVKSYIAQVTSLSQQRFSNLKQCDIRFSGREMANLLWRSLLGIGAYYSAVYNWTEGEALSVAAKDVINYCIILKHNIDGEAQQIIQHQHSDAVYILRATSQGEGGKIQLAFAKANSAEQRIDFWSEYSDKVFKHLDGAEYEVMLESTLEKIEAMGANDKTTPQQKIAAKARFYGIVKSQPAYEQMALRVEGAMVCQLILAMREKNISVQNEPYKSVLSKPELNSGEIVDLLVNLLEKK